MKTLPDYTGKKIGKWVVLGKTGNTQYGTEYLCRCACGREARIVATRLKNAKGCRHCATAKPVLPIGYKINQWTVIGERQVSKTRAEIYKCRCICGFEEYRLAKDLRSGKAIECRFCSLKRHKRVPRNIIGKVFGNWKVIANVDNRHVRCVCQCTHKTIAVIKRSNLISGNCNFCKVCRRAIVSLKQWTGYGGISGQRWCMIKRGASVRKLAFEITIKYAWDLFQEQKGLCALSGLPIGFLAPASESLVTGEEGENTASLDRIDSSKGYIIGNVQWIHKHIQTMKWAHKEEYFLELCQKIINVARNRGRLNTEDKAPGVSQVAFLD